jgi:hypothetical protein
LILSLGPKLECLSWIQSERIYDTWDAKLVSHTVSCHTRSESIVYGNSSRIGIYDACWSGWKSLEVFALALRKRGIRNGNILRVLYDNYAVQFESILRSNGKCIDSVLIGCVDSWGHCCRYCAICHLMWDGTVERFNVVELFVRAVLLFNPGLESALS